MDLPTIGLPLVLGTGITNISQKHVAVPALLAAASRESDSLAAALDALWAAAGAHGEPGYRRFLAQLRNDFPELRT
jgi:hypothetical protein